MMVIKHGIHGIHEIQSLFEVRLSPGTRGLDSWAIPAMASMARSRSVAATEPAFPRGAVNMCEDMVYEMAMGQC